MFTYKQKQALIFLSSGKSVPDTAAEAKISTATIAKWKKEPSFAKELDRLTEAFKESSVAEARRNIASQIEKAAQNVIAVINGVPNIQNKTLAASIKLLQSHGMMCYQPTSNGYSATAVEAKMPDGLIEEAPVSADQSGNIIQLTQPVKAAQA